MLFSVHNEKFRPLHKKTILSLQYCKLSREEKENTKEWMGRLIKANEHKYKKKDRCLKEKCINSNNDNIITAEIIKELITMRKINK